MQITLTNISDDEISPYGKIIQMPVHAGFTFSSVHFRYWKQQAILDIDSPVEVGFLHVNHHYMLFNQMEKHDKTAELLIPLNGDFIIPVSISAVGPPYMKEVKAFKVKQGQAILLNAGCWHWMPCPVGKEVSILVIFRDNTSLNDTTIEDLSEDCIIQA